MNMRAKGGQAQQQQQIQVCLLTFARAKVKIVYIFKGNLDQMSGDLNLGDVNPGQEPRRPCRTEGDDPNCIQ